MDEFIEKVIEAAEGYSWKIAQAFHSRIIPHLMRSQMLSLEEANLQAQEPFRAVLKAMENHDLELQQIRKILAEISRPFFNSKNQRAD